MRSYQAGFSLLEVVVCVALVAVVLGGAAAAFGSVAKNLAPDPQRVAASQAAAEVIAAARLAAKYSGSVSVSPSAYATTAPMPMGTPLPISISLRASAGGASTSTHLTTTVTYQKNGATQTYSTSADVMQLAPPPNAVIDETPVAAPSGAP